MVRILVGGVMIAALAWSLMAAAPYCNLVQNTRGMQHSLATVVVRFAHIPHLLAEGNNTLR